jgi:signal transduction histidine kinase
MMVMDTAGGRGGGWPGRGRRFAASPYAPALIGPFLALAAVGEAMAREAEASAREPQSLLFDMVAACVLALATTVPTAFLEPASAAVAVTAASVLSLSAFQMITVAGVLAQLLVLYRLGRAEPWPGRAHVAVPGLAVPFLILALTGPRPAASEEGLLTVLLASLGPAAALAGIARRARDEARVHSSARETVAQALTEHTARGERARIARELHDVVAHHISMISVQAETARLTTPGLPPAGAQRLLEIGDTARAGLTEMRRLLGVLREDAQAEVAQRHPQPGLEQLNELIDDAREASGTAVRLIVSGSPVDLDPGVELATYRIVQEALTNARRHAPGAAVDVELHYAEDTLRLRIRDNGPGPPPPSQEAASAASSRPSSGLRLSRTGAQNRTSESMTSMNTGHGLAGMRERAMAAGGELRTGPAPGGGFLIEAALPVKTEADG